MKKLFLVAAASCLLAGLSGCTLTSSKQPSAAINQAEKNEILFQSMQMLNGFEEFASPQLGNLKAAQRAISAEEKATIESLLLQFDSLFSEESNFVTTVKTSDRTEYANLIEVSYALFGEEASAFSVYYNETVLESSTPSSSASSHIEDDEDEKEDEELDDEQESETVSSLKGLLVKDAKEYSLMARKEFETETEDGKTETESKLTVTLDNQSGYLIHAEEETEIEENETSTFFSYKVIDTSLTENNVIKRYSIEKEVEDGTRELELRLNDSKYEIEEEIKGEDTYYVISVKNDTSKDNQITYKKVVTSAEDGSVTISFVEVTA